MDLATQTIPSENVSVSMKKATATWTVPDPPSNENSSAKSEKPKPQMNEVTTLKAPTLKNINVDFPKGKLIGIIGPVGAGKSSFLQVLLREFPLDSGFLSVNGSVSYASQEPWVFAASVRQNILFGQDYDHDRYNSVAKTCALLPDFQQFENGDRTIVGEKGTLSGGQKARIK